MAQWNTMISSVLIFAQRACVRLELIASHNTISELCSHNWNVNILCAKVMRSCDKENISDQIEVQSVHCSYVWMPRINIKYRITTRKSKFIRCQVEWCPSIGYNRQQAHAVQCVPLFAWHQQWTDLIKVKIIYMVYSNRMGKQFVASVCAIAHSRGHAGTRDSNAKEKRNCHMCKCVPAS